MSDNLSPREINKYILKAALNNEDVFKSFKKLSKRQENLNYIDFEWRYFKYYHGNDDLTIEKSPENSSSLTFDDLPDEMIGEIVSKLNLINRLKSRRVCSKMLHANPKMTPKIDMLGVTVRKGEIYVKFDGNWVGYVRKEDGECYVRRTQPRNCVTMQEDYVTRAIEDFGITLNIPKINVEHFSVEIGENTGSEEVLQSLKKSFSSRVLLVEKALIRTESYEKTVQILTLFKPKVLYQFYASVYGGAESGDISGLVAMEQFKNVKEIGLLGLIIFDANLIYNHFRHFQSFTIHVHSMSVDQILRLREMIITEFHSTHFKSCLIQFDKRLTISDYESMRRYLGMAEDERRFIFSSQSFGFQWSLLEIQDSES